MDGGGGRPGRGNAVGDQDAVGLDQERSMSEGNAVKPAPRSMVCQADGCGKDLSSDKVYYQRHRVCADHLKLLSVRVADIDCRFCQQCARFHSVNEFDGNKRSCRTRLLQHNARRRCRPESETIAEAPTTATAPSLAAPADSLPGSNADNQRSRNPGHTLSQSLSNSTNPGSMQALSSLTNPAATGASDAGGEDPLSARRPVRAAAVAAANAVAAFSAPARPAQATQHRRRSGNPSTTTRSRSKSSADEDYRAGGQGVAGQQREQQNQPRPHDPPACAASLPFDESDEAGVLQELLGSSGQGAQQQSHSQSCLKSKHLAYFAQDTEPFVSVPSFPCRVPPHASLSSNQLGRPRNSIQFPHRSDVPPVGPDLMQLQIRSGSFEQPRHYSRMTYQTEVCLPEQMPASFATQLQQQSRKRPGGPGSGPTNSPTAGSGPGSFNSTAMPCWPNSTDGFMLPRPDCMPLSRLGSLDTSVVRGPPSGSDSGLVSRVRGCGSPASGVSGNCSPRQPPTRRATFTGTRLRAASFNVGTAFAAQRALSSHGSRQDLAQSPRQGQVQVPALSSADGDGGRGLPGCRQMDSAPQEAWLLSTAAADGLPLVEDPGDGTQPQLDSERPSTRQRSTPRECAATPLASPLTNRPLATEQGIGTGDALGGASFAAANSTRQPGAHQHFMNGGGDRTDDIGAMDTLPMAPGRGNKVIDDSMDGYGDSQGSDGETGGGGDGWWGRDADPVQAALDRLSAGGDGRRTSRVQQHGYVDADMVKTGLASEVYMDADKHPAAQQPYTNGCLFDAVCGMPASGMSCDMDSNPHITIQNSVNATALARPLPCWDSAQHYPMHNAGSDVALSSLHAAVSKARPIMRGAAEPSYGPEPGSLSQSVFTFEMAGCSERTAHGQALETTVQYPGLMEDHEQATANAWDKWRGRLSAGMDASITRCPLQEGKQGPGQTKHSQHTARAANQDQKQLPPLHMLDDTPVFDCLTPSYMLMPPQHPMQQQQQQQRSSLSQSMSPRDQQLLLQMPQPPAAKEQHAMLQQAPELRKSQIQMELQAQPHRMRHTPMPYHRSHYQQKQVTAGDSNQPQQQPQQSDDSAMLTLVSVRVANRMPHELPPDLYSRLLNLVTTTDSTRLQSMLQEQCADARKSLPRST